MTDLRTRFQSLDDLHAPDLWHEAQSRAQALEQRRARPVSWVLIALVLLLGLAISGAALIGSGVIKLPALVDASASPSGTAPEASAPPTPEPHLGGGLMIVHEAYDPSHPGPLEVFTLDAGTGQQTLLGTLQPVGGSSTSLNRYSFQWGADRKHVLITLNGQGPIPLDNQSDEGRELTFICCEPPAEVIQLPPDEVTPGKTQYSQARGYDWALSPQGDRIAGLHNGVIHTPGCALCSAPDSIVILDVDNGDLRTLPLPPGSLGSLSRYPISWSPDESAVVIGGCRPCNDPYSPGVADITPTAVEHGHLFIVPVDGSPVRELLDVTETELYSAAWSPDGTTIAFGRYECAADEHAPYCQRGTHSLVTLNVANGEDTVVAEVTGDRLVWSPDGRRITFADQSVFVVDADGNHLTKVADGWEPTWSPDSEWLLFSPISDAPSTTIGPSIVPADGGEPRLLGQYGGWGW
jgi:hypothetical protein